PGACFTDWPGTLLARCRLLRLGRDGNRQAAALGGDGDDPQPSLPTHRLARRRTLPDRPERHSHGERREVVHRVEISPEVGGSRVRHHAHHAAELAGRRLRRGKPRLYVDCFGRASSHAFAYFHETYTA